MLGAVNLPLIAVQSVVGFSCFYRCQTLTVYVQCRFTSGLLPGGWKRRSWMRQPVVPSTATRHSADRHSGSLAGVAKAPTKDHPRGLSRVEPRLSGLVLPLLAAWERQRGLILMASLPFARAGSRPPEGISRPPARRKVPPKVLRALPERPAESPGEVSWRSAGQGGLGVSLSFLDPGQPCLESRAPRWIALLLIRPLFFRSTAQSPPSVLDADAEAIHHSGGGVGEGPVSPAQCLS
jgi:hypothetical protein